MAITQEVCNSFKTQVLRGVHNFTNLSLTPSAVAAGTGVYTVGSVASGANNGWAGLVFVMAGFGTAANNGTFLCTASSATTVTTTNVNSANSGAMGTVVSGHAFKLALYTAAATMGKATTNYATTNECSDSGTYAAGGAALTSVTPALDTDTAVCDFADISFTAATLAAAGALIYNSSVVANATGGAGVVVLTCVGSSTLGTFTITFPAPAAATAILRIA